MTKKGDLVEYNKKSDVPYITIAVGGAGAEYAVCVEDEKPHSYVLLVVNDDVDKPFLIPTRWIIAEGWAGWIPENCEKAYEEINEYDDGEDW